MVTSAARIALALMIGGSLIGAPVIAVAQETTPSLKDAVSASTKEAAQADTTNASQEAPVNGILYIYGNERCPTDNNGNEIVVCERRSAAEKYRLPKDLRPSSIKPQYQAWAQRSQATLAVGQDGIGSCSATGVGGASGCSAQAFAAAKAEARARKRDENAEKPQ